MTNSQDKKSKVRIELIEDSNLELRRSSIGTLRSLDLGDKQAQVGVVIAPFRMEHYNDIDLFKKKLYCDRHGYKLIVYGSLNYLPVHALYADQLLLTDDVRHLSELYERKVSVLNVPKPPMDLLPWFVNVDGQTDKLSQAAEEEVSDNDVVSAFWNVPVRIRKSTYELFLSLQLPRDIILLEIKSDSRDNIEAVRKHAHEFSSPVVGIDYEFQNELLNKVGMHYLGIQILGSLLLNWQIIGIGGSARLFSLLPTRNLLLVTHDIHPRMMSVLRKMAMRRYAWKETRNSTLPWAGMEYNNVLQNPENIRQLDRLRESIIWPEVEVVPYCREAEGVVKNQSSNKMRI